MRFYLYFLSGRQSLLSMAARPYFIKNFLYLLFQDINCDTMGNQTYFREEVLPMPQMNKGGKFIFGKSVVRQDGTIQIPPQAIQEYNITAEKRVYLFTGSKITGGFCVTRKGLLEPSKLGHILTDTPELQNYTLPYGEFIKYKGRFYCWADISETGQIVLTLPMMDFLNITPNMELLSIRSSDIAFTMGAKGPLLEKAENFEGHIPIF